MRDEPLSPYAHFASHICLRFSTVLSADALTIHSITGEG